MTFFFSRQSWQKKQKKTVKYISALLSTNLPFFSLPCSVTLRLRTRTRPQTTQWKNKKQEKCIFKKPTEKTNKQTKKPTNSQEQEIWTLNCFSFRHFKKKELSWPSLISAWGGGLKGFVSLGTSPVSSPFPVWLTSLTLPLTPPPRVLLNSFSLFFPRDCRSSSYLM